MKNVLLMLLLLFIIMPEKFLNAQQITGSPAEAKMSTMLIKKFRRFQKDVSVTKISAAEYKQKYSSKFFPVDFKGRIFLDITAIRNINAIANTITSWGGEIHNQGKINLYAWVPMDKLADLAALDGVTFIDASGYSSTSTGSVTSAGGSQLLADSARSIFYTNGADINGNPVKVGVTSNGMQYYTLSQQSGDLPYNNFGWVTVNGVAGTNFIGSEGTAMMEIVHDLAPGAGLYFGGVGEYVNSNNDTIQTTPLDMANTISYLSTSSQCKVIVDDIWWKTGVPWFEDGTISQAISSFQSNGGTYVSAAGNLAEDMYSGQPDIKTGGNKNWVLFTSSDTALKFTISNYKSIFVALQWDDAWGNASDDYNLYLYDSSWRLIDSSTNPQSGSGYYPQEYFGLTYSNYLNNATFYVMVNYNNYNTGRPLKHLKVLIYPDDGNTDPNNKPNFALTNRSTSGHIFGYTAAPGVISVAAYDASTPSSVESFSSRGPSLMFTAGNPANETSRNTPVITATDGVETYVGQQGYFGNPFYGTSAAAPHVAAIAALYYSRYPSQTASQFTSAITASAKSIGGGAGGTWNYTSGYGKISAYDALVKGLTVINSPQVSSNTAWDLNNITGTASIAACVTVTVDANYTTVISGTVNLGDANSKILVYGTLILTSTASVNPASGLVLESGGRIYSPNMVTVTVNQLDANNNPFGYVGHWKFSAFDSSLVPYNFPSFAGTPERMRGYQYFKSGTTQKFQLWNGSNARVINPDTFKTAAGYPKYITSQFATATNATLQSSLEGVAPGGSLNFLDPWLKDTTDAYGQRNQGMADWYRPLSYSANNLDTGTSHMGMFLNKNVADSAYYSVRAPLTQTINGYTGYFQNWTTTNATVQQAGSNPSGYDQKAVVFTQGNAVVTANYKGHLISTTTSATTNNDQRSLTEDAYGVYHLVYQSAGDIWYTRSTDNGVTWSPEIMLSAGNGTAHNPSITDQQLNTNFIYAFWVDKCSTGQGYSIYERKFYPSNWQWEGITEVSPISIYNTGVAKWNAKPAGITYANQSSYYGMVAYEDTLAGTTNIIFSHYDPNQGKDVWYNNYSVPNINSSAENPSLFCDEYNNKVYIAYDNSTDVYMSYWDLTQIPLST